MLSKLNKLLQTILFIVPSTIGYTLMFASGLIVIPFAHIVGYIIKSYNIADGTYDNRYKGNLLSINELFFYSKLKKGVINIWNKG